MKPCPEERNLPRKNPGCKPELTSKASVPHPTHFIVPVNKGFELYNIVLIVADLSSETEMLGAIASNEFVKTTSVSVLQNIPDKYENISNVLGD